MLSRRPIQVFRLPLGKQSSITSPESTILRFNSHDAVDIGALVFRTRGGMASARTSLREGTKAERLVDLKSKDVSRMRPLNDLISYLDQRLRLKLNRPSTLFYQAYNVARFIDWTDKVRIPFPLENAMAAKVALEAFIEHLRERIRRGALKAKTAAQYQFVLVQLLEELLPDIENLKNELNFIEHPRHGENATEPPSEIAQAKVLGLAHCLFSGLGDLVLNHRPYPYQLTVPKSVANAEGLLWIFPSKKWCMPPGEQKTRHKLKVAYWIWDYKLGRLSDPKHIEDKYVHDPSKSTKAALAVRQIALARSRLLRANEDPTNHYRMEAAMYAHNAFIVLFLASTGMNWASVCELRWSGGIMDVGSERQGFRTVKHRAKGRLVSFEIQATLLPLFRTFLRLREFVLNGRKFDFLFVGASASAKTLRPLQSSTLKSIIDAMNRLDPSLPRITSRQWRAGKSDWLLRTTDPITAALVLQNSQETVLRSYAAGSHLQQSKEMETFLSQLGSVVLSKSSRSRRAQECGLGTCKSFGNPKQIATAPVAVDCRSSEGCLFCEKFRVHADEKDTRKLLSSRYCLQQAGKLVGSVERFNAVAIPIFERIDGLLSEISLRSNGLVDRVRSEVENGELDKYWTQKLEMLMELGLVSE